MSNKTEIKPQNLPKLALFFVLNVSAFFILASEESFNVSMWVFIKDVAQSEKGAIFLIASLAIIVLDGVVPSGLKDILIYWRWPYPLPACRIFSKISKKKSHAINIGVLKRKYANPFPKPPEEQNKLWLDIYEKYQDHPSVSQINRVYLLTREMTSLSFLFLILFAPAMFLHKMDKPDTLLQWIYPAVLAVQFFLIAISSRNYGNGLVSIVLARASATAR